MKLSRADRSLLATWSFTIDRSLLMALLSLIAIGVVLSFAASPAVALKKGLPTYYFVERHVVFAAWVRCVMLAVSLLSPVGVRRLAAVMLLGAVACMIAVLFSGAELNGAQRWLEFGGYTLQPSEFAKPAFVVILAWLFAEASERSDMPALPMALVLWAVLVGLLVAQPDIGQTVLISTTAGLLYLLAGLPPIGAAILLLAGSCGMWLAYENFGHVQIAAREILQCRAVRELPSRPRHAIVLGRGIFRPRARRGNDQIRAAGRAYRLHFRGHRRRVRCSGRLHCAARCLCLHRRQVDDARR